MRKMISDNPPHLLASAIKLLLPDPKRLGEAEGLRGEIALMESLLDGCKKATAPHFWYQ